jgi:mannosyltransferase
MAARIRPAGPNELPGAQDPHLTEPEFLARRAGPAGAEDSTWRTPGVPSRRTPDWTLLAPPAVTLAVMLWGIGAPSYWRDEADTVSAVSRTLPQLIRLLGHVDAVHGTYYLLLWPVTRILGTNEFATRLPSALAMAAAALGVAAIARMLRSRRAALCAGLVFAALPAVSAQGHDARPYAMVTAAAVLASYLLIRTVHDPRPRRFTGYGLSLVLLGYMHMFGLLLVPAHAIALTGLAKRPNRPGGGQPGSRGGTALGPDNGLLRRWLVTVAIVGVAVAPQVVIGWVQRGQIGWISRPGWHDVGLLITSLAGGPGVSAVALGLLAVLGGTRGDPPAAAWLAGSGWLADSGWPTGSGWPARLCWRARLAWPPGPGAPADRSWRGLTWLSAPWLVLPPVVLLTVSQVRPIYYFLYVVFCLPAVALLAGAGLSALGWPVRIAVLALIVTLALPMEMAMRVPVSGGALGHADQTLAAYERPGDAVIYPTDAIPPWYLAFPDGFGQLRNIGMWQSGAAVGRLYGTRVPLPVLAQRECGVRRIWAAEMGPNWQDPVAYLVPGFRLVHEWRIDAQNMRLWLYQAPHGAACQGGRLSLGASQ